MQSIAGEHVMKCMHRKLSGYVSLVTVLAGLMFAHSIGPPLGLKQHAIIHFCDRV